MSGRELVVRGQAWVDGAGPGRATLVVGQEFREERFLQVAEPDPGWSHTDPAGHFHAFTGEGDLPTLKEFSRHIDCDGSCGFPAGCAGWNEPVWRCRICQAEVEPGRRVERDVVRVFPGLRYWSLEVAVPDPTVFAGEVSVRVRADGREWFGVGAAGSDWVFESGAVPRARFAGYGPLGERRVDVPAGSGAS